MAAKDTMDYIKGASVPVLTVPPPDLRSLNTVRQTLFTGRNPYIITPSETKTYSKTMKKLRLDLPQTGIYDPTTGYLQWYAKTNIAPAGGPPPVTWCRFMPLANSVIYAIRLYQGTRNVAEIVDYGMKAQLEWEHEREPNYATNHQDEIGVGTQATRITWSTGRYYIVPIDFGPLMRPLNMNLMKGPMYLEIEFYDPADCLECDAGTPVATIDYNINNVSWVVDQLPSIPSGFLAANGNLVGGQWQVLEDDIYEISVTATTKASLEVPFTGMSVQDIAIVQWTDTQKGDPHFTSGGTLDPRWIYMPQNNTKYIRWRINGAYFPHDVIDCTDVDHKSEAWIAYKKAFNIQRLSQKMYDSKLNINRTQFYSGDRYYLITSMEQNHAPGDLNPVSIQGKGSLFLDIEWTVPTTTRLYIHVFHWTVYEISGDGLIRAGR